MIWRNTGPGHDIAIAYVVPDPTKSGRVVDASLLRTLLVDKVGPCYPATPVSPRTRADRCLLFAAQTSPTLTSILPQGPR